MAAPPLPPKSSSNSWTARDNGIVGSNRNQNTYPPVVSSQSHFLAQISGSSTQAVPTAPPLPPRPALSKWPINYSNIDILSVVPHASAATFKNSSNNQSPDTTMNMSGNFSAGVLFSAMNGNLPANFNTLPTGRYPLAMANQPLHHNQPFQKLPAFNNPQALCFTNNMYQASFVPYVPQSFDIQHSKSAPDLAVFKPNTVSNFHRFSIPNNNFISTTSSITTQTNFSTASNKNTQADLENVLKFMKKKRDSNLIDLYTGESESLNTNYNGNKKNHIDDILRLFDPLAEIEETVLPICKEDNNNVQEICDTLVKEVYVSDQKETACSIESRPRNINEPKSDGTVYTTIKCTSPPSNVILKVIPRKSVYNPEVHDFCEKLQKLRSEFSFDDSPTNVGVVISPTLDSGQGNALSIQLIIASGYAQRPVSFTCDVNTSIEHIISHTVCTLIENTLSVCMDDFILKVHGLSEYFTAHSSLSDYEYVHQCHKFDRPVQLALVDVKDLQKPLSRTKRDDFNDVDFKVKDILPIQKKGVISYDSLNILTETLEKEIEKIKSNALSYESDHVLSPQGVVQAVKAICTLLSHVETVEITDAVSSLIHVSLLFEKSEESSSDILPELGALSASLKPSAKKGELLQSLFQLLELSLQQLQQAIHQLFAMYTKTFHMDFEVQCSKDTSCTKSVSDFLDTLLLQICMVHGLSSNTCSQFSNYNITCDICYGKNSLASVVSKSVSPTKSFFPQLLFEEWLQFETVSMCTLPQEAILYLTLWGINPITTDVKQQFDSNLPVKTSLGWCGIKLFNFKGELQQGNLLVGIWPPDIPKYSGPVLSNPDCSCPLIQIGLPEFDCIVKFPRVIHNKFASIQRRDFESLDSHVQESLMDIINKNVLAPLKPEEKELLWEKRNYLYEFPQALPKVLLSAHGWDWACLSDIYSLLRGWKPLSPVDSLRLLLPCYPDREVRKVAIQWMKDIVSDELCDYLPQMVQVLRYEYWDDSPVVWFLLERSLTSIRVAHYLYWLLKENVSDQIAGTRMQLMKNALLMVVGSALRNRVESQEALLTNLSDIAEKIKKTKESLRLSVLFHELEITHHNLADNPTCLALSPSLEVSGVDVKSCSYFTSNTLPLKLSFHSLEGKNTEAIYKVGDDLRQDMITLQMIRIMDKLWLKEGLDLKIVTFMCVATEFRKGMVELVPEAETLRKIQTELGLTGSFKDRSISEWLQKYNTSELEYQQAVDNFTLSCAGYCVATYILGICDRHNDNIMLKTSGHIFHIDFGKFLGDAQMLGSIKRDRTPFVLTSDMAYVINGGDKPSKKFQYFIDLCCQAFNIIRQHSSIFFNLFTLMVSSDIPGLSMDAVNYIQKALLPELSEAEATARFTHMIQDSLKSWFTQFNFFIHNLAQLRFTGDHNDDLLLSFIPKTFSKEADGKILLASVIGCKKMYDPEKYYIYIVKIERQNQPVSACVFRTYREFIEFHQKLCMMFPLAKFHPLPGNPLMGRTNIRDVADRRRQELQVFVQRLFTLAEEISHCDLVYTFFHPLLRDQEGMAEAKEAKAAMMRARRGSSVGNVHGQIKLSIVHKNGCLFIMIMHAKNLSSLKGTVPDPYVKTYLLPDPNKLTKRKTKTVSKNCHPTFMEMLVYDLPLEVVRHRKLFVSVWNYDRVQENEFLGAVTIPLTDGPLNKERIQWYQLGTFTL